MKLGLMGTCAGCGAEVPPDTAAEEDGQHRCCSCSTDRTLLLEADLARIMTPAPTRRDTLVDLRPYGAGVH